MQMCVDYRALIKKTKCSRFPLPNVKELFYAVAEMTSYSILDLKSG